MNNYIINFDSFDGPNPYSFLSNFYVGKPILVFGGRWRTGEHAFQAMKSTDAMEQARIASAATPGRAKTLGRTTELRDDWEEIKYDVMMAIIRAKFTAKRAEGRMLLDTGDALLIEGTQWGDRVWGVAGRRLTSPGRNWLGTMLMARRAELRSGYKIDTGKYNQDFVQKKKEGR